jgi:hypothetical protein
MNLPGLRPAGPIPTVHPVVRQRRLADAVTVTLTAAIPAITAAAVTIALPGASLVIVLGVIAVLIGIVALMMSPRLDLTVALVLVYLGLLNGPIKMFTSTRELTAAIQDIVIFAVAAGALMRIVVRREQIKWPLLAGWIFAWVGLVVVNAFNPRTEGLLHALGGFRTELQYVPFFFFGYYLMRSKQRFRQLFLIVGVVALANGVVAAYQTKLSPEQLSAWGPGYQALIHPEGGKGGRVYVSEGEGRVRPPGLGTDGGFSGAAGQIALPMCLALLVITRKRKWVPAVLCAGAAVAVMAGLGRLELIGTVLAIGAFIGLTALSGRKFTRAMGTLMAVVLLIIPVGGLVASVLRSGTFKRYESIGANQETALHKEAAWSKVPTYAETAPLGFGLGNSGPVSGLGGSTANKNLIEGHGLTSESQYNVLVKELGAPGLILWPLMVIYVSWLMVTGMHRIRDPDIAICLAGTMASFPLLLIQGLNAFLLEGTVTGPYFFFAIGVAGYWFARPRYALSQPGGQDATVPAAI